MGHQQGGLLPLALRSACLKAQGFFPFPLPLSLPLPQLLLPLPPSPLSLFPFSFSFDGPGSFSPEAQGQERALHLPVCLSLESLREGINNHPFINFTGGTSRATELRTCPGQRSVIVWAKSGERIRQTHWPPLRYSLCSHRSLGQELDPEAAGEWPPRPEALLKHLLL